MVPNSAIDRPQSRIAATIAMPCRWIRWIQPPVSPPISEPIASPAFSMPSASPPPTGPPKVSCAICGNSARGMPKTIAMMSTTNVISSSGLEPQVGSPSSTFARPRRSPSGGIGGSLTTAYRIATRVSASMK